MTKRILRRPEVEHKTGLSRSTIYARMEQETFPKPIPLGGRLVGWLESDVNEWVEQQINSAQSAA